jgi:transcriptional regulator with XRE-family HTH domain
MTIGKKLTSLRKAKKLSQKAVAEALGISSRTYLRWEKDESKPSKDALKKLSDLYGEELSAYVDGKNVEKPDSVNANGSDKPVKSTKATKVMPKDPAVKKKVPADPKHTITAELQYSGKAIPISEIYSRAKEACGNDSDIKIYIKPEENRVYFVSGDSAGSFEI